jgi:hypothetical protein
VAYRVAKRRVLRTIDHVEPVASPACAQAGLADALSVEPVACGASAVFEVSSEASVVWGGQPEHDSTSSRLYRRAVTATWSENDLEWSRPNPECHFRVERDLQRVHRRSAFAAFSVDDWNDFDERCLRYFMSQLIYGEQLSVVAAGQIVASAPSWDAKSFAAVQAADEVRHTAVFTRYAAELGDLYPMNGQLQALLSDALSSGRWEMLYVATQVLVEGLALGSFDMISQHSRDPLLDRILHLVGIDEARHVTFGVAELQHIIQQSSSAENAELAEFCFESAVAMRGRMVAVPVLEEMGIDAEAQLRVAHRSAEHRQFEQTLYAHVRRLARRSGLGDVNGKWLEQRFNTARLGGTQNS